MPDFPDHQYVPREQRIEGTPTPGVRPALSALPSLAHRERLPLGTPNSPSLTASATRITSKQLKRRSGFSGPEDWQEDAWEMYDLVGEQRFLATTLSNRLSQVRFFPATLPEDPTDDPIPVTDESSLAYRVFQHFGGTPAGRAQIVGRLGLNLFIAGDGWVVGVPKHLMPELRDTADADVARMMVDDSEDPDAGLNLTDLTWRMLSVDEVSKVEDQIQLRFGESTEDHVTVAPEDVMLIRVWRPHPRRSWKADSPTRSSLPVLRELVGLTMHVSAQIDSRLAGAGVFIIPASARRAIAVAMGVDPDGEDDVFTEALMDAMITPISDRANASAVVPLVITVPDETTGLFQHITFSSTLDQEARNLREEALRRLALGQDAPPELLLGTAGMNHWGAWLVREDVVTTHIEPPTQLICDAVTTQYHQAILRDNGMPEDEVQKNIIWYDVSHMITRPNRLADAQALHTSKVITDKALRTAANFDDTDAPDTPRLSITLAVQMATANPALVDNMQEIVDHFDLLLGTKPEDDKASDTVTVDPDEDRAAREASPRTIAPERNAPDSGTAVPEGGALSMKSKSRRNAGASALRTMQAQGSEVFASEDTDVSKSVCIMALPAEDDPVHEIGPEEKHATVLYFGNWDEGADPERLQDSKALFQSVLATAAQSSVEPFEAQVTGVEDLGHGGNPAKVWMLDSEHLQFLFSDISDIDSEIQSMYDDASQDATRYPEYLPHVSIGYPADGHMAPDAIDEARKISTITFDRLALWWGDERYEFPLGKKEGK